ncbi:MAG: GGDEF domain-containing protein [Burkholderiales bacterium PBB5]|nr:MAG: GGDEF domain-containing protein [Burkholderiales bacterium PBB5]
MGSREWLAPSPAANQFDTRGELTSIATALLRSACTLLDVEDEQEVLQRYCSLLTEQVPGILLAWTWFGPPDTAVIEPQVCAGPISSYAEGLSIPRNLITERGPAYRALAGERMEPFGVSRLSPFGPWRHAARDHGVRNVLALPLRSSVDAQRGVLLMYACEDNYFGQVGVPVFEALAELFSGVLSRAARQKALQTAVTRDALTGLMNRHAQDHLQHRLVRRDSGDAPAAVLLIDIDHFKRVNDTHGHAGGDAVLKNVAQLLLANVRLGDLVMRWGGEEFLIGLPGADDSAALAVAEKLRGCLGAAVQAMPDGASLRVTASIGVACLQPGDTLDEAVTRADAALYAAKRGGRDRTVFG